MRLKREQCPSCAKKGADNSKDNLITFPEGHKHCFACGFHVPTGGKVTKQPVKAVQLPKSKTAVRVPNHNCISAKTLKKFGVRNPLKPTLSSAEIPQDKVLLFPYFQMVGEEAVLVGLKRRDYSVNSKKQAITFNGSQTIFGLNVSTGSRTLIICEGEPDAMAMFQHSGYKADVWGLAGASTTNKLKEVNHLLERYSTIILCFDPDQAGQDAVEAALEFLPEYKTRVMELPLDVCDFVESSKKLAPYIKRARKVGTSNLLYGSELVRGYFNYLTETASKGFDTGFDGINAMLGGELKRTEVLMLAAHTGRGKSTLALNIAYNICDLNDTRVMWVSTEMLGYQMVHKCVELDLQKEVKLKDGEMDTSIDEIAESMAWISDKLVIYNGEHMMDSIIPAVHEAIASRDVGVLVIDVLNDIDADISDWKEARNIMSKINALAQGSPKDKRPPISIILVAHSKLRDGKYASTLTLSDIAGGSTLVRQCTAIMAMDGEILKRRRYLKMLKLPRMGTALKAECELLYSVKRREYEEVSPND